MRLFAALELPEDIGEALVGWGRACAGRDDALRAVGRDALHVTLAFLGERPEDEVEPLRWALADLAPVPSIPLTLGGAIWLAPKRPHVLACAVEDDAGLLAALHGRVVEALAGASGWVPERRPFVPHITVCRVRGGRRPRIEGVTGPGERLFTSPALVLMRSELGGGPARYTVLERVRASLG